MISKSKRPGRTRSSRKYCQEKLCCRSENTEATSHCADCKTNQCSDCDKNIHSSSVKYEFHDRKPIERPPFEELCQVSAISANRSCSNNNFADVYCENCNLNFCFDCNENVHSSSSKKSHRRISYKEHKHKELQAAFQVNNPIQPINPIVFEDDSSLTFLSCPQYSDDMSSDFNSLESMSSLSPKIQVPDICLSTDKDIIGQLDEVQLEDERYKNCECFMLADELESLQVNGDDDLMKKLACDKDTKVKVVSIFGNTGDGKSHTLNHTFFAGKEVFPVSAHQTSCTVGVWAAYDPENSAIIVDTEGLLGETSNANQRTRLLLKVLAISDVVIYRTRAERLHNDMFSFLSDASTAYMRHFSEELRLAAKRFGLANSVSTLGPAIIIFHETVHTNVLGSRQRSKSAESTLKDRFKELDLTIDAFSCLKYVGTQTLRPPTDFTSLNKTIKECLDDNSIRASRSPSVIYHALQVLNDKFSGEIEREGPNTFPDQYFTCTAKCLSCSARCMRSMNHDVDNISHHTEKVHCQYQHQYDNKVFLCKNCFINGGKKVYVVPKTSSSGDSNLVGFAKYLWAGYVLECPNCGIIYRSHQYWYGNEDIEKVAQVEVRHVWPDRGSRSLQGSHNAARRVIDSFTTVKTAISSVGAKPTKVLTDWMADQIAPSYWIPNSAITICTKCEKLLNENEQKHHCRACGQGFCDDCSTNKKPVPERGWGEEPVRVCDFCYEKSCLTDSSGSTGSDTQIRARKVGEAVSTTLGAVASVIDYPLEMLKDASRPAYWVPDEEAEICFICKMPFGPKLTIHHCRACGQCVCDMCSPNKRPVPLRGWDYPVRVCNKCEKKKDSID